jgi:hypothetical protein
MSRKYVLLYRKRPRMPCLGAGRKGKGDFSLLFLLSNHESKPYSGIGEKKGNPI